MSPAPDLERSVLERKEREELHAIADAMGLKPGSRTRKADLIDKILEATGVDLAGANGAEPAAPPKRTRARAKTAGNGGANGSASEAAVEVTAEPAPDGQRKQEQTEAAAPVGEASGPAADVARPAEPGRDEAGRDGGEAGRADAATTTAAAPSTAGTRPADERDRDRDRDRDRERPGTHPGTDSIEPGNRLSSRRRRRGRDRDRDRERDLQPDRGEQFQGELVAVEGLLDLTDQGFGFLRTSGFLASSRDVYVSISQVRRFALRKGDYVHGAMRPANTNEKYPALVRIDTVSGLSPDEARARPRFEDLTPLFPDERLKLEVAGESHNVMARIIDLVSPIGKGQRGLIVSPPKAGKTTVMKQIAHSIEANNPDVHLMVLLVDERPEEVTDMRRSVSRAEVVASTFDRPSDEHTQIAELTMERARRLVEMGRDVVIILDGITRLARAYNLSAPASGRLLSGGIDSAALYPPKKFFGSARNIEEGGSLTVLATALVETGSKMDEVIFEEFKGTGNMELRLDRKLAERRIFPAIDVNASSTRHEELLFERKHLDLVWRLRRVLNGLAEDGSPARGLELLMDKIKTTKSNEEFLAEIAKAPVPAM